MPIQKKLILLIPFMCMCAYYAYSHYAKQQQSSTAIELIDPSPNSSVPSSPADNTKDTTTPAITTIASKDVNTTKHTETDKLAENLDALKNTLTESKENLKNSEQNAAQMLEKAALVSQQISQTDKQLQLMGLLSSEAAETGAKDEPDSAGLSIEDRTAALRKKIEVLQNKQ